VGSHFDRYYFEGEVFEKGKETVLAGVDKGIFEKSDGAVIFPGEKFGLHNRVFVTGEGNPTYEGKDMGLAPLQFAEYNPDLIIHCVGPEQESYFRVVFEALAQMFPETRGKEYHLIYGWVRLKHGKMSSRTGNVILGEWLIDEAKKAVKAILAESRMKYDAETEEDIAEKAAVAAVKYAFLRVSTRSDIAFDFAESVTFSGESGPYLQYVYARCMSVLRKSAESHQKPKLQGGTVSQLEPEERSVMRRLLYYPDIVEESARTYSPNTLCTYLFQLSQEFNLFYAKLPIVKSADRAPMRLALTEAVAHTLQNGLNLLGIDTIERM
jgi:arginyl-tRNA synthetase